MRRPLALAFAAILLGLTWLRSNPPAADTRSKLAIQPIGLAGNCCMAGPLRLAGLWQLSSKHPAFGGYSALLAIVPGRLLAFSDRGYSLDFAKPGALASPAQFRAIYPDAAAAAKASRDVEAAAWDPVTRRLWLAQEGRNAIARYGFDMTLEARRQVPEWQQWPQNSGSEAMLRLADGRFIVLCECRDSWLGEYSHPAFLYPSDPTASVAGQAFSFAGIDGYRPTDMAQLPDGRVLILMRRLVWPLPPRFAVKVAIADPASLVPGQVWKAEELADIGVPWPVDNYEGIAIERQADGQLVAWIISDENGAVSQRVLLLKVLIDEARLPPKQKAPG